MQSGTKVRVLSGRYAGVVGEFIGEGDRGVSVKPDGSSIILAIPKKGKEPVIELFNEGTPSPNFEPRA